MARSIAHDGRQRPVVTSPVIEPRSRRMPDNLKERTIRLRVRDDAARKFNRRHPAKDGV